MARFLKTLVFATAFIAAVCLIVPAGKAQNARVEPLLDSLSVQYDWIEYRLAQERWKHLTGASADSIAFFEDLASHIISNPATLQRLKSVTAGNLSDDYRRKHQFFLQAGVVESVAMSAAIRSVTDSLHRGYALDILTVDGAETDSVGLAERIAYSNTPAVRERAFRILFAGSESRADQLASLLRLRNQEAGRVGYNNYAALWFGHDAISLDDYARLLTELEAATDEAYGSLVTRLRASLTSSALQVWDLDAAAGAARQRELAVFTEDTLFPVMHATLQATGFNFDDLPIYYHWTDSGRSMPITAIAVRTPVDQRLVGTLRPGHATEQRLLGQTGLVVYSAYVREDDPLFNRMLDGPMQVAVARLFETMTGRDAWLTNVVGMPAPQASLLATTARDRILIHLRRLLTLATFELEAYRNPNRDLNKLYWDTFDRIMNLPRHMDLYPWAARAGLVNKPFGAGSELLGWMIAAQTWAYLRDFSGSVVQSRDTRAFLVQNYFRFGARFTWPELLVRGTGNSLNPKHIQLFLAK